MSTAERRYQVALAEADMDSVRAALARLRNALEEAGAEPVLIEVCRLAQLDASSLQGRVRGLRNRIEATG